MNKRSVLGNGDKIVLTGENKEKISFIINSCIGFGGNAIVYEVCYGKNEIGRLKEFYPVSSEIHRDENGNIMIDESIKKKFNHSKKKFEMVLKKRAKLRKLNINISATMPEFCQLLRGKNTSYIFQSYTNGQCYANIYGETMEDIFHTAIGLVNAVKCYHDIGYVHLDLKPQNMLVNKQENNNVRVQLFDYETATLIDDLKNGKVKYLPYTKDYSSPEQIKGEFSKIDISSDIFSIGVILFYRIMGRFPNPSSDLALGVKYDYTGNDLFQGISPIIKRDLDIIFNHTIRISEKVRYKEDKDLMLQLQKLLKLSKKSYGIIQKNNYICDLENFYGRCDELNELEDLLSVYSCILIYGMGGIGKSELIKQYLTCNSSEYEKIIYIEETKNNIRDAIVNDDNIKIDGMTKLLEVSDEDYFNNKIEQIKEEYNQIKNQQKEMIIVFDNVEYFLNLKYFKQVKEIGCKIVVISRNILNGFPVDKKMELGSIKDEDALLEMFMFYYEDFNLSEEDIAAIKQIITYYNGHTLVLELMAKEMQSSWTTPSETLLKLQEKGINSSGEEEITYLKGDKIKQEKIDDILYNVFDSGNFSVAEISVLQFMSLLPTDGIEKAEYKKISKEIKTVKELIYKGFVKENKNFIKIHPIIKETMIKRYPLEDLKICEYIEYIKKIFSTKKEFYALSYKGIVTFVNIGHTLVQMTDIKDAVFYEYLATACQKIGQKDYAIRYYNNNIALLKEEYGEEHEKVALAYLRCGKILEMNGEYEKSREYFKKASNYYSDLLFEEDDILTPLGESLDDDSSKETMTLGTASTGTAISGFAGAAATSSKATLAWLGGGAMALGVPICVAGLLMIPSLMKGIVAEPALKLPSIIKMPKEIRKKYKKQLNKSEKYNQLAKWHYKQGEYKIAFKYCQEALKLTDEYLHTYQEVIIDRICFSDTFGEIFFEAGNYEIALNAYRSSHSARKYSLYIKKTINFFPSYLGLAKCHYMLKEYEKALEYIQKAISLSEEKNGMENIDTLKAYHYMAKIYQELNEYEEAGMYYEQSMQIAPKLLGKMNHLTILINVDYLDFLKNCMGVTITKETYLDLKEKIQSKVRPYTTTFQLLYEKMKLFCEDVYPSDNIYWIERINEIVDKVKVLKNLS